MYIFVMVSEVHIHICMYNMHILPPLPNRGQWPFQLRYGSARRPPHQNSLCLFVSISVLSFTGNLLFID